MEAKRSKEQALIYAKHIFEKAAMKGLHTSISCGRDSSDGAIEISVYYRGLEERHIAREIAELTTGLYEESEEVSGSGICGVISGWIEIRINYE